LATVLFVCHANICRSPMAERLARLALSGATGLAAASAGTHARPGEQMHPWAAQVLNELGADDLAFASRPLDAELLGQAALVLAATREQRAICVRLAPSAIGRTFTIGQFCRLAAAVDPAGITGNDAGARLPSVLTGVIRARATHQPLVPADDDLADPIGGTETDMRACAARLQRWLRPALQLIAGT
jgi:protein-tyrosine phosphatase